MKVLFVLAAVACVASAGYLGAPTAIVRAPAFDSAVIKSDRIGGNFAYSTAENHAYAAVSPVISQVATPVAVSYSAPAVHTVAHTVAAPLAYSGVYGHGIYGHGYGHGYGYGGLYGGARVLAL